MPRASISELESPIVLNDSDVSAGSKNSEVIKGIMLFSFGIASFTVSAYLVKICITNYNASASECIFYVYFIQFCLNYLYVRYYEVDMFNIPHEVRIYLFGRSFSQFMSDACLFASFQYISYSKGFCLFFLNTILFPFVAWLFLDYSLIGIDYIAVIFAFIALAFMIQPYQTEIKFQISGDILGVLSAVFAALTIIFMRKAQNKVDVRLSPLYSMVMGTVLGPVWELLYPRRYVDG